MYFRGMTLYKIIKNVNQLFAWHYFFKGAFFALFVRKKVIKIEKKNFNSFKIFDFDYF